MNRVKLADRRLPPYSHGEEIFNMVTHIVGGLFGVLMLVLCLVFSILHDKGTAGVLSAVVYGTTMTALYVLSSIYHGLRPGIGKKVMQVLDHCTIYLMIAGTYTPMALLALRPAFPVAAWGLLGAEWGLTALAATLTAIDLKKYRIFSLICYIGIGWAMIFVLPQTLAVLGMGMWWLLAGGVWYTVGAVLYALGGKRKWMHSIFHIFVLMGSFAHGVVMLFYVF